MLEKFKSLAWQMQLLVLVGSRIFALFYGLVFRNQRNPRRSPDIKRSGQPTENPKRSGKSRHAAHQRISFTLCQQIGRNMTN